VALYERRYFDSYMAHAGGGPSSWRWKNILALDITRAVDFIG
jgi:hypothetical protein